MVSSIHYFLNDLWLKRRVSLLVRELKNIERQWQLFHNATIEIVCVIHNYKCWRFFWIEIREIFVVGNWESLVLDRTLSAPNQTLKHVLLFPVCEKTKGCLAIFEHRVPPKIWSCVVLTAVNFISLVPRGVWYLKFISLAPLFIPCESKVGQQQGGRHPFSKKYCMNLRFFYIWTLQKLLERACIQPQFHLIRTVEGWKSNFLSMLVQLLSICLGYKLINCLCGSL